MQIKEKEEDKTPELRSKEVLSVPVALRPEPTGPINVECAAITSESLSKPRMPKIYLQVLPLIVTQRPLFPGFFLRCFLQSCWQTLPGDAVWRHHPIPGQVMFLQRKGPAHSDSAIIY